MDISKINIDNVNYDVKDAAARKAIMELSDKVNNLIIPTFNNVGMISIKNSVNVINPNITLESVGAIKQFGWVQLVIYGKMTLTKTSMTQDGFTISDERFFIKPGTIYSAIMAGYASTEDWQVAIGRITVENGNQFKIAEQDVSGEYLLRTVVMYPAANP